jgi:hypothetical protein
MPDCENGARTKAPAHWRAARGPGERLIRLPVHALDLMSLEGLRDERRVTKVGRAVSE